MNIVAQRLKEAMNEANLRQIDIVNKTGINKGALSSYLSGKYLPKVDNLEKLSNILNVNKLWLLGYNVPKTGSYDESKIKIKKDEYIIIPYNIADFKKGEIIKYSEFINFVEKLEDDIVSITQHSKKIKNLNERLEKYKKQLAELEALWVDGKLSKNDYEEKNKKLEIEYSLIKKQITKLEREFNKFEDNF